MSFKMRAFLVFIVVIVIATFFCPIDGRPQSDVQSRILSDGTQFVQHPQGAQSYYLPPVVRSNQLQLQPQQQQQQQQLQQQSQQDSISTAAVEQIQLQIPLDTNANNEIDEKKIVLHLPPQQYPVQQQQLQYAQLPPRKHYKIILLRSPPAPTPAPQPVVPEIEEQTLIYVLVKKPDEPSAQELEKIHQAQQDAIKFNKPEVFFIKYKGNDVQQPVQAPTVTSTNSQAASIDSIIQKPGQAQQQTLPSINNIREQGYNYSASRVARQLDVSDDGDADADGNKDSRVDSQIDEIMME